jgi:hypothetical protein
MFPHNMLFMVKKFTPPLARWGVAAGSVVFFLGHEDIPSIVLETPYGAPTTWKDVGVAMGLIKQ